MLPRSVLYELSYSLIPGTLIVGGAFLARPDFFWSLFALKELSELAKLGTLGLAIFVSGYLCMAVVGSILVLFFASLFSAVYIFSTRNLPKSYGRSIIWRRLATKLAGEGISSVQTAGLPMDEFKTKTETLIAEARAELQTKAEEPEKTDNSMNDSQGALMKALAGKLGDALGFALLEAAREPTDLEWESVYRILGDYFHRPTPEVYYSSMALVSSGAVLGTAYYGWFSSHSILWWIAAVIFVAGAISSGVIGIAVSNGAKGDEVQAAEILRVLKPRPKSALE